jgi:uncharacterized protein affecting Mg2+/Co2+ transport
MHGSDRCIADDGVEFDVAIPEFVLSVPHALH